MMVVMMMMVMMMMMMMMTVNLLGAQYSCASRAEAAQML